MRESICAGDKRERAGKRWKEGLPPGLRRLVTHGLLPGLVFLALCLGAGVCRAGETDTLTTTVMIYLCGSSLESKGGAASNDIEEMLSSGFDSEHTQVVILGDGTTEWMEKNRSLFSPGAGNVYRLEKKKKENRCQLKALAKLDDCDMGRKETLSSFLSLCREEAPAQRYALVLWDHGAGPVNGVCYDENHLTHLTVEDISEALQENHFQEEKLEWIGFDACLMSSVEVADALSPYAKYMVASQAREPSSGWNYNFLKGIEMDEDGAQTGQRIIEGYMSTPQNGNPVLTLACLDLAAIGQVEESMDEMYSALARDVSRDTFSTISKLRLPAMNFGAGARFVEGSDCYDLVDLVSLTRCFAGRGGDRAQKVEEGVKKAVVHFQTTLEDDCFGLSVYHPFRNQVRFKGEWKDAYKELGFCQGYTSYVEAYGSIMTGSHIVSWNALDDILAEEGEKEGQSKISLSLTKEQAENLASARLVVFGRNFYDVADDSFFRVYSSADVGILGNQVFAVYEGNGMQVMDAAGISSLTGAVSYQVTEDGAYLIYFYPIDEEGNREEIPFLGRYILEENGELVLQDYEVYDELTGTYSTRGGVDLSKYKGITFQNDYRTKTINEAGEILAFEEWELDVHQDTHWKARNDISRTNFSLSLALDLSRAEDLYAAFELTDTQGNVTMSEMVSLPSPIRFADNEVSYGEELPYVLDTWAYTDWEHRFIGLEFALLNLSDEVQKYYLSDVCVNGRVIPDLFGYCQDAKEGAEPGQRAYLRLFLDDAFLEEEVYAETGPVLKTISGTLMVLDQEGNSAAMVGVSCQPEVSLDYIFHSEGDISEEESGGKEIAFTYPAIGEEPFLTYSYTVIQPGTLSEDSKITVHMVLRNTCGEDLFLTVGHPTANGALFQKASRNFDGSGEEVDGKRGIAPGENGSFSFTFDYRDIASLAPEVLLEEVSFPLYVSRGQGDKKKVTFALQIYLDMEIPLQDFYGETAALPSRDLLEEGRKMGALGKDPALLLLDRNDCSLYLQGVFIEEKTYVMLLRGENNSDHEQTVYLGRAAFDGQAARIGRSSNVFLKARNNRSRFHYLDSLPWDEPTGAVLQLQPGVDSYWYVSVQAVEDVQEVYQVSFEACMKNIDEAMEITYLGRIGIMTEEAAPLLEGTEAIALAEDYQILTEEDHGTDEVHDEQQGSLFEKIAVSDSGLEAKPSVLCFTLPEGEEMEVGFYCLFRRIASDAQLAKNNIVNFTEEENRSALVSFAEGQQWLLYESGGEVKPALDGTYEGLFSGLRLSLLYGEDKIPVYILQQTMDNSGTWVFDQVGDKCPLTLMSADFPDLIIPYGIRGTEVVYDPAAGTAALTGYSQEREDKNFLAGLVSQEVYLLPGKSGPDELLEFMYYQQRDYALRQILPVNNGKLMPELEAYPDVEELMVSLYYVNTEGEVKCTELLPWEEVVKRP